MKRSGLLCVLLWAAQSAGAQKPGLAELSGPWSCRRASDVHPSGEALSMPGDSLKGWTPAVVPGTVLTSLLNAGQVPDPFYGMNNKRIPDIYNTGVAQYTYWFVKDFSCKGGNAWLQFRGVNYGFDAYLNGHRLTDSTHYGMFLRAEFDITPWLASDGHNRLAVIVYPPDPPGNPNGGQGGDGTIARNVTQQYVAGWDWIQPIHDRNTGIWDKVFLRRTGAVKIDHPHVVTTVPGARCSAGPQAPAFLSVTAELTNTSDFRQTGILFYVRAGRMVSSRVILAANSTQLVALPADTIRHPRLWWPNGYGAQPLYTIHLRFGSSDDVPLTFGVRELGATWNAHTRSRQISVNGRRIFIRGGNWIVSDAMLRLSEARYDAEVRFHRDMRLNLIRVWGGALTERPEFYDACDRYGLLVMQDFWNSGDCNGRWRDPKKLESQAIRRGYPEDHDLFVRSAADQIRMLRNHPSLAFWCGGNEITPPEDILHALQDSLIPGLDGTRWFATYSNTDSMSLNVLGGNGDGPYGVQPLSTFWAHRTFPFNSEVGSVGLSDLTSLERFLPAVNRAPPLRGSALDSVWAYHKFLPYGSFPEAYGGGIGEAEDGAPTLAAFTRVAQLINYDQYRGLAEGFRAHAWDWYTGVIIWKTQNPWTAMRGQMYDYYLDPNACLYGLREGGEVVHAALDPVTEKLCLLNGGEPRHLLLRARAYDMGGKETLLANRWVNLGADTAAEGPDLHGALDTLRATRGAFLLLELLGAGSVSRNLYWLPDSSGRYSGLRKLANTRLDVRIVSVQKGKVLVSLHNPGHIPAFFNRLSVMDGTTRLLPTFYSDNYDSIMPGETRTVTVEWPVSTSLHPDLSVEGWNVPMTRVRL
jgi:mannosylglycoprotein endo-beta-mannosidase